MELQVRAIGTTVSPGLKQYIDERMAKLDRIAEHVIDARLELRTETKRFGHELTTAQLTLKTGRHIIRAEERDAEAAKAVDAAIDKLVRQVRKYNDRRNERRQRPAPEIQEPVVDQVSELDTLDDDEVDQGKIVRTKRFTLKPMSVDEAIDQMDLIGHDFFVFQNADEDQLNVLYRRRDGSLGLLAPTT